MKIETAIKLLKQDLGDPGSVDIMDLNKAQAIGIEALKYYQETRPSEVSSFCPLLPGETKD